MAEATITTKNGKPVPNKKKKKGLAGWQIALIVLLSIFVGLPLLSAGIFYACFYDGNFTGRRGQSGYPTEKVFKQIILDSFDNTETEHQIRVRLTEDNINQVLRNALDGTGDTGGLVNNVYVAIGNTYDFTMEVNIYNFFKTKLTIATALTIDDTNITFGIADITVGRIHGMNALVNGVLKNVSEADFNNAFHNSGIDLTVDFANLRLIYPIESFYNNLSKMLGNESTYTSMLKEMVTNKDLRTFYPIKDRAIECAINLEAMKLTDEITGISGYHIPSGYLTGVINHAKTTVVSILNEGLVNESDLNVLVKYYMLGHDRLSGDEANTIDSYLSSSTIPTASSATIYNSGLTEDDQLKKIAEKQIQDQIAEDPFRETVTVTVTNAQIDKMFKESSIIGTSFPFGKMDSDGNSKVHIMSLSRITSLIKGNNLFVVISVNISGYEIDLALKTTFESSQESYGTVKFSVSDMYLGSVKVNDDTKAALMSLIETSVGAAAFNDNVSLVTVGGVLYLTVSIKSFLESNGVPSAAFDSAFSMTDSTVNTSGAFTFTATRK